MPKLLYPFIPSCQGRKPLIKTKSFNGMMHTRKLSRSSKISAQVLLYWHLQTLIKPVKLHTDASTAGLGAILYQEQDGKDKVTAYAVGLLVRLKVNIQLIRWNSQPSNRPLLKTFMNTCVITLSLSIQTITPWLMPLLKQR